MLNISRFKKNVTSIALAAAMAVASAPYYTSGVYASSDTGDDSKGAYVLMNIPYGDFYAAETKEHIEVDAVSSATKMKPRTGTLAGGSYHVNSDGSDITGVIYPVKVEDISVLEGYKEITDDDTVTITVTNRGQETTTEYAGKDALFEAPSYSYYILSEEPKFYKELTEEGGSFIFSKIDAEPKDVDVSESAIEIEYHSHHNNFIEINLGAVEGVTGEDDPPVSGAIATLSDGTELPLTHIANIWRKSWIGWNQPDDIEGQTITNVRFFNQEGIYDCRVDIAVKPDADGTVAAKFEDEKTIAVTGLPNDIQNPLATVQSQVGRGETPVVIAENAEVKDGKITATDTAVKGTAYTVEIISDNYADISTTAVYSDGQDFLSQLKGEYQPLFEGATLESKYDHYWHDYAAAVVGESKVNDVVEYVKKAINASGYGENAQPPDFYCGFTEGVENISFGGDDGRTVTFMKTDGSSVTHKYDFVKEANASGEYSSEQYGEMNMVMDGYLYKAQEDTNDEFQYLFMRPDTPETTYHLEFRYGDTEENILKLTDGKYAYWLAAGIRTSAMTEEDEDTLQNVISLFVVENTVSMSDGNEETAAQRKGLVGIWDCDPSILGGVSEGHETAAIDSMYIVLSADGTGKTYAVFTGSSEPVLMAEYTFFAYDPDKTDGKDKGTYIALNEKAGTVTPGYYEITETDGKKALVFTSNEGKITYYSRGAAVIEVDGAYYSDLQDAVNAVADGGTIILHSDCEGDNVTVSEVKTFKVDKGSNSFNSGIIRGTGRYTVKTETIGDSIIEFKVSKTSSSGGGGGGGGGTVVTPNTPVNPAAPSDPADPTEPADPSNPENPENPENPSANTEAQFTDVPEGAWYSDAVKWAVENSITTGTSDNEFSPEDSCTRGQMVTFLWRAAGSPEPASSDNPFTDVDMDLYYGKAVLWAAEQGITTGKTPDKFGPDDTVDRGQTVTFIWRAAGKPGASASSQFKDIDSGMFYVDAVKWAVEQGIAQGMGDNLFAPENDCTRGQIVTLLHRYYA